MRDNPLRAAGALTLALALSALGAAGATPAMAGPFAGCSASSLSAQDLSGCNFAKSGTVLVGIDLGGKDLRLATFPNDLRRANFAGANLSGATFHKSNLTAANLSNANLTGANLPTPTLTNANLNGSQLAGATLRYVWSGGIKGTPASLPNGNWRLIDGFLIGPTAHFSGADLRGADLSNLDLTDSWFPQTMGPECFNSSECTIGVPPVIPGANLSGADLRGTDLSGTNLGGVNLSGATLSPSTDLSSAVTGPIVGTPASWPDSWRLIRQYLFAPGAIIGASDTYRSYLIPQADFTGVDFRGMDLRGIAFSYALVDGANVDGCDLSSSFGFGYAGSKAQKVIGTPSALPPSISFVKGYLVGSKAFLPLALLEDADLSNMVLTDANLAAAVLRGANLTGLDAGGDYVPADDATSASSPANAAASKGGTPGARMFRSILTNANISNSKLRYAGLAGVISGGLRGQPKYLPTGWMLAKGYLIGPKANLTGAKLNAVDFKTTNLSGTKLTGADLTGAKLSKAKLTGVISSGLVGKPASLPKGWKINTAGKLVRG